MEDTTFYLWNYTDGWHQVSSVSELFTWIKREWDNPIVLVHDEDLRDYILGSCLMYGVAIREMDICPKATQISSVVFKSGRNWVFTSDRFMPHYFAGNKIHVPN